MVKKINIIFFGLGSIGQRHLQNISKIYPKAKLFCFKKYKNTFEIKNGIVDRKINIIKKYNIKKIYKLSEIKKNKINYAFICNPSSLHVQYAISLAKLGVNLFIEKPLSNSMKNVNKLKKIINKKKLQCMVGFNLRYNECYKFIKKKLLNNKFFGMIYKIDLYNGEFLPNYHPYEDYKKSYAAKKSLGGGVLLTQIHELDMILSLFGKPIKVYSKISKLSNLKIDVEDNVDALMVMKNDISLNLHLDYFTNPPTRYLKIYGYKKILFWDYYKNEITILNRNNKEKKVKFKKFNRNKMFIDEIKDFFNAKKNKKMFPNIDDGIESLKLTLLIKNQFNLKKLNKS